MMITDIEDYFTKGCGRCARFATADCATRTWQRGLQDLRRLCRQAGLQETLKWGHPCYVHAGRNIAIVGAFQKDFRLSFFNAALMKDPNAILEKQGKNTQHADMIRFDRNEGPVARETEILAYLEEAKGYAEAGIKPARQHKDLVLPDELVDALDADPELSAAFHALTPGRQKSYVINLNSAKKPETRQARIEKFRDKIIAGKGALER